MALGFLCPHDHMVFEFRLELFFCFFFNKIKMDHSNGIWWHCFNLFSLTTPWLWDNQLQIIWTWKLVYDHFAVVERRKTGIRLEAESYSMDEIAWSGISCSLLLLFVVSLITVLFGRCHVGFFVSCYSLWFIYIYIYIYIYKRDYLYSKSSKIWYFCQ